MDFNLYLTIIIVVLSLSLCGCVKDNEIVPYNNENISRNIDVTKENYNKKDNISNSENNRKLMEYIKNESKKGFNICCNNIKLGDNISDVIDIYGQATNHNYVHDAKGVYYTYKENSMTFGCNKGEQIFEIRSYDDKLKNLSLSDINEYFGMPDYENKTSKGEKVIGYKVSDLYKLLFVFDDKTLDHYSVFYPEITANYMADDPGRQW